MANFISIFRIFVMFFAVYLIYTTEGNAVSYVWALALTIIAFALDGVDGYVARKLHMKNQSLVRFLILWVIELLKILTGYCLQLWVGLVSYSRLLLLQEDLLLIQSEVQQWRWYDSFWNAS